MGGDLLPTARNGDNLCVVLLLLLLLLAGSDLAGWLLCSVSGAGTGMCQGAAGGGGGGGGGGHQHIEI